MVEYNTALKKSIEYFEGDTLAANVFLGKYALKEDGVLVEETPRDMHHRLASEFARIEARYPNPLSEEKIFSLLDQFKYIIPQGSPMAGIGNKKQKLSISNCFVIDSPHDSYGGIMKADEEMAQIMKRRGGVGLDISKIRPKGLATSNAAQTTDGIGLFMERFSKTCREVAQGGRRGALMLTISVHHPEIRTFVHIKEDLKKVTGANISVRLSDEFMKAVKNKEQFELRFPVDSPNPIYTEMVDAEALWTEIIEAARNSAEPGLLFWDSVMKFCPANCYPEFITISTNPCGEITLSAYDSCRLLVLNVLSFVRNPFTKNAEMDWKLFAETTQIAQRLMDDVVDLELEAIDKILEKINSDPEPEEVKAVELRLWKRIKEACIKGRRTGLGVTAVGDFLAAMNVKYGSEDSLRLVEYLYRTLAVNSYKSSITLAEERGAFPAFDVNLEEGHPFLQRIWDAEPGLHKKYLQHGRRNIANLTTAPTGSVSLLAKSVIGFGTTSGIENVLFIRSIRRKKINPNDKDATVDFIDELGDKWSEYSVYHQGFKAWKEIVGKSDSDIQESPYWESTADDVNWIAKVDMQGLAQKWIDHSISNTTNLPEDVTVSTVKDVYMRGWEVGCKGVTIYRKNSRTGVILDEKTTKKNKEELFQEHHALKRPLELECDVYHSTIQGEKWTIFVGKLQGKPYEIMGGLSKFVTLPRRVKTGKIVKHNGHINPAKYNFHYDFANPEDETVIQDIGNVFENPVHSAFTRTISLSLRHGVPPQFIVEQLLKGAEKESDLFSFSKVISRVIKNYIVDGSKPTQKVCPDCKSTNLSYQQGCVMCTDCGSSKCG